nr:zf-CCHC domain-containing protein [Ipomoea batatas]
MKNKALVHHLQQSFFVVRPPEEKVAIVDLLLSPSSFCLVCDFFAGGGRERGVVAAVVKTMVIIVVEWDGGDAAAGGGEVGGLRGSGVGGEKIKVESIVAAAVCDVIQVAVSLALMVVTKVVAATSEADVVVKSAVMAGPSRIISSAKPNNKASTYQPNPKSYTTPIIGIGNCSKCGELGHRSNECTAQMSANLIKEYVEDDEKRDGYDEEDIKVLEDVGDPVNSCMQRHHEEEKSPNQHNISRANGSMFGKVCKLTIDDGDCYNINSKILDRHLDLEIEAQPKLYIMEVDKSYEGIVRWPMSAHEFYWHQLDSRNLEVEAFTELIMTLYYSDELTIEVNLLSTTLARQSWSKMIKGPSTWLLKNGITEADIVWTLPQCHGKDILLDSRFVPTFSYNGKRATEGIRSKDWRKVFHFIEGFGGLKTYHKMQPFFKTLDNETPQ